MKELVDNGEILPEIAATVRPDDITAFYRSPLGLRLLTLPIPGRSRREQPFVMGLTAEEAGLSKEITDRILIQGIIDVYFEEEDGLVLLDYKTVMSVPAKSTYWRNAITYSCSITGKHWRWQPEKW